MQTKSLQVGPIEERIFYIRGHRVMHDTHLAELYGVKLKALVQAVKRNRERFPVDFLFQLDGIEFKFLRSQFVTSKMGRGGRRYLPYAFTENGVAMLSSVLNSQRAIRVNIQIMRAFTRLREWLGSHRDLQEKVKRLERKFGRKFAVVFSAIQLLLDGPKRRFRIKGFKK